MKVLSLWEPWATLMALDAKRIETRSWGTEYRGWLAIHAAKGGLTIADLTRQCTEPYFYEALCRHEPFAAQVIATVRTKKWIREVFPFGCIVAVVKLVDCVGTHNLWTFERCLRCEGKGVYGCWQDGQPGLDHCPLCDGSGVQVIIHAGKLSDKERTFGNYDEGRYGWITEQCFRLPEPIPFKGKQGLFDLPAEIVYELRRQWKAEHAIEVSA